MAVEEEPDDAVESATKLPRGPIRVLVRACTVLDCLGEARTPLGVTEISRRTGLSKSTVHYLLQTLISLDLARLQEDTGRYAIGSTATRWASAFAGTYDPVRVAAPYLVSLRDATMETVTLHLRSGDFRICIGQELSPHPLRRMTEVGAPRPLWFSATGRVLLSTLTNEEIRAYLKRVDRNPPTPRTPTGIDEILALVDEARTLGYAIAFDENEVGVASVSAPINPAQGGSCLALTVAGPSARWTEDAIADKLPLLQETASEIASHIGFTN